METLHQPGDIVGSNAGSAMEKSYRIVTLLGEGAVGRTYEAEDLTNYKRVALKVISLRNIDDWKVLELFEREARILEDLNHRAIPKYLDYFQTDEPSDRHFYLVQELIEGSSLAQLVDTGWRATEEVVKEIAIQVLEILVYLQQLSPPVIHRDVKPQNIIRRPDGRVFLVDFGAVQDVYRNTMTGSSTFVGTWGYMPPEQFRGRVGPASDLYSLAATLVFLLTLASPADLPEKRLKLDFRPKAEISPYFADWLDAMLEPAAEDRFNSATEALAALRGEAEAVHLVEPIRRQPAGSKVVFQKTARKLAIDIPAAGWRSNYLSSTIFGLIFLIFTILIAFYADFFYSLVCLPFWLLGFLLLGGLVYCINVRARLEIDRETFLIEWQCLNWHRKLEGLVADIIMVDMRSNMRVNDQPVFHCALVEGTRTHNFGMMLTQVEKEWLVTEIADFMDKPKSTQQ